MISGMGKLSYSNVNAGEAEGIAVPPVSISFIVCPAPYPSPSTSGICPDTSYFAYTQRAACRRKNGKRKNDEMQAPAACIPATPSAYHTVCFHVKPAKHTGPHGLTPVSCA